MVFQWVLVYVYILRSTIQECRVSHLGSCCSEANGCCRGRATWQHGSASGARKRLACSHGCCLHPLPWGPRVDAGRLDQREPRLVAANAQHEGSFAFRDSCQATHIRTSLPTIGPPSAAQGESPGWRSCRALPFVSCAHGFAEACWYLRRDFKQLFMFTCSKRIPNLCLLPARGSPRARLG